jgi:hypothetical protein
VSPLARKIRAAITGHRFRYASEHELHHGIAAALRSAGLTPKGEVRLSGGRIDFLVDRVGVEVKLAGSAETVARQLARYVPDVDELVLVTTKSTHRRIPPRLAGTEVTVVMVQEAAW